MQSWYRPHPYGVYPRGNATSPAEITDRLGAFSPFTHATTHDNTEHTELPFIELVQTLLSFLEAPELCRLARTCTGFYVLVHCTDAFKNAYTLVSPGRLRFHHSWRETAIRGYLRAEGKITPDEEEQMNVAEAEALRQARNGDKAACDEGSGSAATKKKARKEDTKESAMLLLLPRPYAHTPVTVRRRYFCDQLFQAWMCTILPTHYHLHPVPAPGEKASSSPSSSVQHTRDTNGGDVLQLKRKRDCEMDAAGAGTPTPTTPTPNSTVLKTEPAPPVLPQQYTSPFKSVPRCANLSADEFCEQYEKPNLPVVLTGIASEWPMYKILNGNFGNFADKRAELVRAGCSVDAPLRCEYTNMSLSDYVRYCREQQDERPTYMFDAEFWKVIDTEKLYTVPDHFARDDFFSAMGTDRRPKFRWILAGPARGGSSFHVDPNYTHAWNANLTGRKRWLLFPPGAAPPGCVPSEDMSEVATPLSLTEWLLNFYDASVEQLRHVGYECICEPGDIMFVPCGWWHSVVNLEDSVAITHNYVSQSNLTSVVKFLRVMKGSISGINEDCDDVSEEETARRRQKFADEFVDAMHVKHPAAMQAAVAQIATEHAEREKKRVGHVTMLETGSDGFKFEF